MRIILCLLLVSSTAPAWAEWERITAAKDGSVTYYIEPAKIRKNGNFRKVWQVIDFKQRNKNGEMSARILFEYDCKEERYRILSFSDHSEPMAAGKTLSSGDNPDKWSAIPPASIAETILKTVCVDLIAAPASAEWVKVTEDGNPATYIDANSFSKNGHFRKVWEISDLQQRADDGAMSWRSLVEYNCNEKQYRLLLASQHSELMAEGKILWSHNVPDKWRAIRSGSTVEYLLDLVCAM